MVKQSEIGDYYIPNYEGSIDLFIDQNGTTYTVNQGLADFHYKWGTGRHGIGYYLQDK